MAVSLPIGNEETVFVLAGTGTLWLDEKMFPLEEGDHVALPGDERGARRVINDSDEPLRCLAVSTVREPDVTVDPDSGKVGVFAGAPPGGEGERDVHGTIDSRTRSTTGPVRRTRTDADPRR